MMLEIALQLDKYISSLEEPQRFIAFMLVYAGLPILIVLLLILSNKLEERKQEN